MADDKKYIEVVDWRIIRDKNVREMEKQAKRNAVEDGRFLYNSGESRAQQADFLSHCILGSSSSIGAAGNYTAATSPKPIKNIAYNEAEVKSVAGLRQMTKRL